MKKKTNETLVLDVIYDGNSVAVHGWSEILQKSINFDFKF